ncbi:MAG: hypothetical protein R2932_33890 [Caldilineaceae bacterium]
MNDREIDSSTSTGQPTIAAARWRFIAPKEYQSPSPPTTETVRSTVRDVRSWFVHAVQRKRDTAPEESAPKLQTAPQGLLDWIAPPPDWGEIGYAALDKAVADWHNTEANGAGIRILIGAPYSHVREMAIHWGKCHNYAIIKPPTPAQILENDSNWMHQWQQNKAERLILPWLERCYLRHHNGLDLMRRLLDWLWTAKVPALLVVDSWAWRYLQQIYPLDTLDQHPLTLAPLQPVDLDHWFYDLAHQTPQRAFNFRLEHNGAAVLRCAAAQRNGAERNIDHEANAQKPAEYLRHLAARSRGIPGAAWALWRYGLQIAAEEAVEESAKQKVVTAQGKTIWVTAWENLELPEVAEIQQEEAFILHTLLLHSGMHTELLPTVLPCSSARIVRALQKLQNQRLIKEAADGWQVTPLAYVEVRNYLRSEGYLIDEL